MIRLEMVILKRTAKDLNHHQSHAIDSKTVCFRQSSDIGKRNICYRKSVGNK